MPNPNTTSPYDSVENSGDKIGDSKISANSFGSRHLDSARDEANEVLNALPKEEKTRIVHSSEESQTPKKSVNNISSEVIESHSVQAINEAHEVAIRHPTVTTFTIPDKTEGRSVETNTGFNENKVPVNEGGPNRNNNANQRGVQSSEVEREDQTSQQQGQQTKKKTHSNRNSETHDKAGEPQPDPSSDRAATNYAQKNSKVNTTDAQRTGTADVAGHAGSQNQNALLRASVQKGSDSTGIQDNSQYVRDGSPGTKTGAGKGDAFAPGEQNDRGLPESTKDAAGRANALEMNVQRAKSTEVQPGAKTSDGKVQDTGRAEVDRSVVNQNKGDQTTQHAEVQKTGKAINEGGLEQASATGDAKHGIAQKGLIVAGDKGTFSGEKGTVAETHKPGEGPRAQPDKYEPYTGKHEDTTKTRPDKLVDSRADSGKSHQDYDGKQGSKLDVRIDGKGKRIGLDGKEILVWDGKNSPLYPGQKGKRVTRFIDPGKRIGRGPKGKIGDPKANLDPSERAHIDKVIKETDRIFFGEKKQSSKGKSNAGKDKGTKEAGNSGKHGDSRVGSKSSGKATTRGERSGITGKGDVRSGETTTRVSKGDGSSPSSSDGGKTFGSKFGLPDYAPFPGIKLPEFKIRWPGRNQPHGDGTGRGEVGTKVGDRTGKTGKGAIKDVKTDSSKSGDSGIKYSGKKTSLESNIKSINKSVGKLLPNIDRPVKLVRTLPTRSDSMPAGRVAKSYQPQEFKPVEIGTSAQTKSGQDARAARTDTRSTGKPFIPSPISIQPVDWSALKGWMQIRGVLRGGKRRVADRVPKGTRGDTRTVRTDSTKATRSDTKTVRTDSTGKIKIDTSTVVNDSTKTAKTKGKSDAAPETSKGKAKGEPISRIVDGKGKSPSDAKAKGQKFELKESDDAFGGKLPNIKMTYKSNLGGVKTFTGSKINEAGGKNIGDEGKMPARPGEKGKVSSDVKVEAGKKAQETAKKIDQALKPINTAKAGPAKVEPITPRVMKDAQTNLNALEADPKSTKAIKSESDSAKPKLESDKGKLVVEGKDGKAILRELLFNSTLKGGFSRRADRILDGARVIAGKDILSMYIGMEQAKGASIRDVLAGLRVGAVKKNFIPEITESGTYKITRGNQSSAQLIAFASSAKHSAILFGGDSLEKIRSWETTLQEKDELETTLQEDGETEAKDLYSKASGSEDARKSYIVQEGDTPESIAVVQLNDGNLAQLIYEINKPLFQQMYDIYQEQHIDSLPAGTMILLPNKKDIEQFKK